MPERLLTVEALRVKFGAAEALRGVDFELNTGEAVAVLGANGAGKTTLLKAIMGLVRPAAGRVTGPDGRMINAPHQAAKLGLCLVPEGAGVFPDMSVHENLLVGPAALHLGRADEKRQLSAVLERFPVLAARRSQMAGTLSGGERQMLGIARALMVSPKAMLLDEPSLGLAPMAVDGIFEVISTLNREGMSVLLIEQNAHRALSVTSRAVVLERGTARMAGPSAELRLHPQMVDAYLGGTQAAAVEQVAEEAAQAL